MSSNLRVNNILPSVGTNVAIGTAGGSVTLTGAVSGAELSVSGGINVTGVSTFASLNVTGNVSIAGTLTYEDVTNIDSIGIVTARNGITVSAGGINATGVITATSFSGSGSGLTGIVNSGITTVAAGTAAAPSISPTGDSNTGIFFPSADTVAIGEGGVEALRVDSSGRVGIGTDIPGSYDSGGRTLVVSENSTLAGMTLRSSNQGAIYFADGLTGNEAYRGRIEYSHSSDSLNFGTAGTGSKLTLTSAGAVQVANGNLVFSTSGTGIDFSATADATGSTSELLDDYEEGTFTVTMQYYNNGWVDATFSNTPYTTGYYVKVGKMCTAYYYSTDFQLNVGNGTGALFRGLPFSAANLSQGYVAGSITHITCFQQTCQNLYLAPNTAFVIPIQSNSTSTSTWNNTSNVYIMWSITYRTN